MSELVELPLVYVGDVGIAEKIAAGLRGPLHRGMFADARTIPDGAGYVIEASPGRFVVVDEAPTTEREIVKGVVKQAKKGDLVAIAWLEKKGFVSFDAPADRLGRRINIEDEDEEAS